MSEPLLSIRGLKTVREGKTIHDGVDLDLLCGETLVLLGESGSCNASVHRPEPLDAGIASQLAVIPADQRTLPPDLFAITNKLVNGIKVSCK